MTQSIIPRSVAPAVIQLTRSASEYRSRGDVFAAQECERAIEALRGAEREVHAVLAERFDAAGDHDSANAVRRLRFEAAASYSERPAAIGEQLDRRA